MKILFVLFVLASYFSSFAQVGIGTSNPKAQLDIISNSPENPAVIDGILIPRVEKFPVTAPSAAQHGMLVFLNKNLPEFPSGFYFWNNNSAKWETISGSGSANFYKTGTSASPNNITDPLYRMGNVGIGTQELTSKLQVALNSNTDLAIKKGLDVDNNNPATDNLTTYGIESNNRSATNGNKYGIKNNVGGIGSGIHYGIFTETYQNAGTNDIYGIFNRVGRTFGARSNNYGIYTQIGTIQGSGNIYGIYSSALGDANANVYAGYFAGRLGIGLTPEEEYVLPATRGKNEQILTLNSTGTMSWTYNNVSNYSSTGGATGEYAIGDEVYTLRINNEVSGILIPKASDHKGRIIILIGWPGIGSKNLNFSTGDNLLDITTNTTVTSITGRQVYKIQSAGNRWILLGN